MMVPLSNFHKNNEKISRNIILIIFVGNLEDFRRRLQLLHQPGIELSRTGQKQST